MICFALIYMRSIKGVTTKVSKLSRLGDNVISMMNAERHLPSGHDFKSYLSTKVSSTM